MSCETEGRKDGKRVRARSGTEMKEEGRQHEEVNGKARRNGVKEQKERMK